MEIEDISRIVYWVYSFTDIYVCKSIVLTAKGVINIMVRIKRKGIYPFLFWIIGIKRGGEAPFCMVDAIKKRAEYSLLVL